MSDKRLVLMKLDRSKSREERREDFVAFLKRLGVRVKPGPASKGLAEQDLANQLKSWTLRERASDANELQRQRP